MVSSAFHSVGGITCRMQNFSVCLMGRNDFGVAHFTLESPECRLWMVMMRGEFIYQKIDKENYGLPTREEWACSPTQKPSPMQSLVMAWMFEEAQLCRF
jgi:hypothetical protein